MLAKKPASYSDYLQAHLVLPCPIVAPLAAIELEEASPNYRLIEDYKVWFADYR